MQHTPSPSPGGEGGHRARCTDYAERVTPARAIPDPHVGAPAGRAAAQDRRELAGRKADHRIVGIERGDDDLADLAVGAPARRCRARTISTISPSLTIMPSQRVALIGDDADVGMHEAFLHRDARRRERRGAARRVSGSPATSACLTVAAPSPPPDTSIRRLRKSAAPTKARGLSVRITSATAKGVVRSGGDDRAAERLRAGIHQEPVRARDDRRSS